jgi:hypothetical protein
VDFLFVERLGSILLELAEKVQDGLDFPITVLEEVLERIADLLAVDEVFPRVHVDDDDIFGWGHESIFFMASGKEQQKGE